MDIKYKLSNNKRQNPFVPDKPLPFGKLRSDHMFLMDHSENEWHSPRIVPYGEQKLSLGAAVLHYSQTIFEGAKAFKHDNGEIYTFRVAENCQRLNKSAETMIIPKIPVNDQLQALDALLDIDRFCYPEQKNASLYIRPFIFAKEDFLGVRPSQEYTFCIFTSPSGPYYQQGFEPIRLMITDTLHRAAPGGTGTAKAGGNYGGSLRAGKLATSKNAKQVLYVDVSGRYIEEAGAMNHFHVTKNEEIIIPEFTDTILQSITSKSIIDLESRLKHPVKQEKVKLIDFLFGLHSERIVEAGGLGTAAVVSPVGEYVSEKGDLIQVGDGKVGKVTQEMYDLLTGIQYGRLEAPEGWLRKVPRIR